MTELSEGCYIRALGGWFLFPLYDSAFSFSLNLFSINQTMRYSRRYRPEMYRHHDQHRHRRHMENRQIRAGPEPKDSDDKGSWIHGPNETAPPLEVVENLWDEQAQPVNPNESLEPEEAFGLAAHVLEDFKITAASCVDPRKERFYSRRNLPFMVFNDLDDMLFRSMLKGNVYLTWTVLPPGMDARTSRAGLKGRPRISIELSISTGRKCSRAYLFRILLHQMVQ